MSRRGRPVIPPSLKRLLKSPRERSLSRRRAEWPPRFCINGIIMYNQLIR